MKNMLLSHKEMSKQTEYCVLCGTETGYYLWTPIEQRYGYVEGAGQLCKECYKELYPKGTVVHD